MSTAPFADVAPGFRALQQLGLFDFADSEAAAEEALAPFRDAGAEMRTLQLAHDFTLLSAAEWALLPALADPSAHDSIRVPLEQPIAVEPTLVHVAVATADCGGWDLCLLPPGSGSVPPWSVALFAGDVHKLIRLGDEQGMSFDDMPTVVRAFHDRYRQSPSPVGQLVADRNLVALQGVVWTAKYAVQSEPDSVISRVESYVYEMGLV